MLDYLKLFTAFLVAPFLVALLYMTLAYEQICRVYGQPIGLACIIGTFMILIFGFLKDFWTGMIALLTVGICWYAIIKEFL